MLKRLFFLIGSLFMPVIWILYLSQVVQAGNLHQNHKPLNISGSNSLVIDSLFYDGYEFNDADEALALRNVSQTPINLQGWSVSDARQVGSFFSSELVVNPGAVIWAARDDAAFKRQFGFAADIILAPWPGFANSGDEVVLFDPTQAAVDTLVYGDEDSAGSDWVGPALQPYTVRGLFGVEGQILYRKLDQRSGLPVSDSNTALDWAQERGDPINGRKVRYPGWELADSFFPTKISETAVLTLAVAPDNALETLVKFIDVAQQSIFIESLTFENVTIAHAVSAAAARGVEVKVLLEGSPPGGLSSQEKYICQELEMNGGECWFMISDEDQRIADRYRYLHSKFILIDGRFVAISTENFSPDSMPDDDKHDGTYGRRGVVLITDSPTIVDKVYQVFDSDLDPQKYGDLFRWNAAHPTYGAPPSGFSPLLESGGITYNVRFPLPAVYYGDFLFELQQAPENSLRSVDGFLGLIGRVGPGDSIFVEQLTERPHWGAANSNRINDPNPRLEAYINAARRGADVRLLLDRFFDAQESEVSNRATCDLLEQIASDEKIKLTCSRANPTGLGIHNKMILINIAGKGYIHIGSLNGSELSNKGNRELGLMVQSNEAFNLLADMFIRDTPHNYFLPLTLGNYRGPANHVLISEVLYDSFGQDEGEFVELVNPTAQAVDISGYSLSDALNPEEFEDLRHFPAQTVIGIGGVLVVATSADYFWNEYGYWPDFEILDTSLMIPDLIDDPDWGSEETFFRLGNSGDEVILRDERYKIVDVVNFGENGFAEQPGCPLLSGTNHSLERYPYWRDSNNCSSDFRDWPFPSPGKKP